MRMTLMQVQVQSFAKFRKPSRRGRRILETPMKVQFQVEVIVEGLIPDDNREPYGTAKVVLVREGKLYGEPLVGDDFTFMNSDAYDRQPFSTLLTMTVVQVSKRVASEEDEYGEDQYFIRLGDINAEEKDEFAHYIHELCNNRWSWMGPKTVQGTRDEMVRLIEEQLGTQCDSDPIVAFDGETGLYFITDEYQVESLAIAGIDLSEADVASGYGLMWDAESCRTGRNEIVAAETANRAYDQAKIDRLVKEEADEVEEEARKEREEEELKAEKKKRRSERSKKAYETRKRNEVKANVSNQE